MPNLGEEVRIDNFVRVEYNNDGQTEHFVGVIHGIHPNGGSHIDEAEYVVDVIEQDSREKFQCWWKTVDDIEVSRVKKKDADEVLGDNVEFIGMV